MGSFQLFHAQQLDKDLAGISEAAGQPATIRRYTQGGDTGGTPWAGSTASRAYTERRIRLEALRPVTTREVDTGGGRIAAGDMVAILHEAIQPRDRIVVEGVEWQVVSEPRESWLYGRRFQSVVLRRQGNQ